MVKQLVQCRGLAKRVISALSCSLCMLLPPGAYAAGAPAQGEGYRGVGADAIYGNAARRFGHLEYVGFYASAQQHWEFTEELAPFTNLTWVSLYSADDIVARISAARDAGVKAVLSVQPHVFDRNFRKKPDYMASLAALQQRLLYEDLIDTVAMIYPVDEPLSHAASSNATSRRQMHADLAEINEAIAALFPGKPVGVILHYSEIFRDSFSIPEGYDWIGFDCYYSLWDCDGKPMTAYYSRLLDYMNPEQRLMAVPETWVRHRDFERRNLESRSMYEERKQRMVANLQKRLLHHYEIALSDPRFVAFIPFLWSMEEQLGQPENSGFGVDRFAENFPQGGEEFVESLLAIARQIKSGKYRYPSLKLGQTERHYFRPRNHYEGEILAVSENGLVSAWGRNTALPHKSLRMQTVVHVGGQAIYTSRRQRSFILDDGLPASWPWPSTLGVHGYRHKIPAPVWHQLRHPDASVTVRVFGDRAPLNRYLELVAPAR